MSVTEDTRATPRELAKMIEDGFRAALEDFVPEEPAPEREEHADTLIYVQPPNAGQDATYTLAAEAPMLPLSIYCRLTTSNAVANRNVAVEYRSGDGARFLLAGSPVTVPASSTQAFCFFPEAQASWPVEDAALAPLPSQWLSYGQVIAVTVYNGDSGDRLDQVRLVVRPPRARP